MCAGKNFPRTHRIDARKIPVIKIDEKDSYLYRYVQYSQNSTDQCGAICHAGCSVNVAQSKHRPTAIFRTYAFGRRMMMMKILFFFLSCFNDIFPTVSKVLHLPFLDNKCYFYIRTMKIRNIFLKQSHYEKKVLVSRTGV